MSGKADGSRPVRRSGQSGFSLIELMVSTSLTLVVLATTLGALQDAFIIDEGVDLRSEMEHNVRTATNMLTRDLLQAGQGIPAGGIPIPSGTGALPVVRPGPASLTFPAGSLVLPAVTAGQGVGPTVQGRVTDVITILYADATLPMNENPVATIKSDGSEMTIGSGQLTQAVADAIQAGDLIMFSNAFGNAIQEVTSVNKGVQKVYFAASGPMKVNQRTAPAGTIMQLKSGSSFPPTTATRVWMTTYFIDASVPGSPRLMRVLNNRTPRPVALDMEDLQVRYDLVDGVTNPSGVDEPTAPNSAAQIRKVNFQFFARSHKALRSTGQFQRHAAATQVSLRSLSFLDRYQ